MRCRGSIQSYSEGLHSFAFGKQGWTNGHLWLDRGYKGVAFVKRILLCFGVVPGGKLRKLDIVARRNGKRFGLQARRWVVERTFAWLGNYRRLSKDYETLLSSSEAFIYLASCDLMIKRLAKTNPTPWRKRKR